MMRDFGVRGSGGFAVPRSKMPRALRWAFLASTILALTCGSALAQTGSDFKFEVLGATGYAGETITTYVMFSNNYAVNGWQLALRGDNCSNVKIADALEGESLKTAQNGEPVDFLAIDFDVDKHWVKEGVVIDNSQKITLPPGKSYEILALKFKLLDKPCGCTIHIVRFPENIWDPPIWTAVDCEGTSYRNDLVLVDGLIRCKDPGTCPPPDPLPPDWPKFPSEAGFDIMQTKTGTFRFSLYGLGTFNVDENGLVGPTIVYRTGRMAENGCAVVKTHLKQLSLEGKIAVEGWKVVVAENNDVDPTTKKHIYESLGKVTAQACGNPDHDFPAYSYFELYFKVYIYKDPGSTVPDFVLFNKNPKIQRNVVCKLPPIQQVDPYEPPEPINLYDARKPEDTKPVGQILGAHNPEYVPEKKVVGPVFIRGDCDTDGLITITDAIRTFMYLFTGLEPEKMPKCKTACDSNADAKIDLSDGIYTLNFLFTGGPEPPAPFKPFCGRTDPDWEQKSSALWCDEYPLEACSTYLLLQSQ